MYPLQNEHVNVIEYNSEEPFKGQYVEQVIRARDSVFGEMCQEMGIENHQDIRAANMGKRSITKDKLMGWLETVCYVLDSYAVPLLEKGIDLEDRIGTLQSEKIVDQDSIIKLQGKLIEKKDDELSSVKCTVQSEMKMYSSAVTKSCGEALAPKKIQAAVRSVTEKTDRNRNIVIYGVDENEGELLDAKVDEIFAEIEEKPHVQDICRIGKLNNGKCRPIKLTLSSSDRVNEILRKKKRLRNKDGYNSVYLCPDRTVEERKAFKKLLDESRSKQKLDPDGVYIIRNNKIVRISKSDDSVKTD